jgi:hypothetical protein
MKKNKQLTSALRDLDQAFDNLEVAPLAQDDVLSRITGGCCKVQFTGVPCNTNVTCNSKCGPTCFWECG